MTKKIVRNSLLLSVMLFSVILFLNYFLANRLEKYLRKELIQRISDATDNFYTLSYDNLSINLLNGELRIEGIEFKPDSTVYQQWEQRDSLPNIFLKAKMDAIDFTGVNLIWRWNYTRLHFKSFEIQSPVIEITNSSYSSRFENKPRETTQTKTLYQLIEPYINELTVKNINIEQVNVIYSIESQSKPMVYKLEDVNFTAYNFVVDSLSSQSGELLYADNFEFVTNTHQTILETNEFSLKTDSIRLSTSDSVIYFNNIHFIPQENLWSGIEKKPSNYLDGQIKEVEVSGVFFRRENAFSYLEASKFNVSSPDIKIYNLVKDVQQETQASSANNVDSLIQSLSPYQLISPILHSVSIDLISLENAKADYYYSFNDSIESFHMDSLNFYAYDFLVDSLSEIDPRFWYCRSFVFDATGMEGMLKGRNHRISVRHFDLDTEKGLFNVDNIYLNPLSTHTVNDYMKGDIRSVNVKKLVYDNGINAGLLQIESPHIRYVKASSVDKKETNPSDKISQTDIQALLNPLFRYLSIQDISVNHADMYFYDKNEVDSATYSLRDFNFRATQFLIDEHTIKRTNKIFFDYQDFGFSFRNFDSYLSDKKYRFMLNDAVFSTKDRKLSLKDVAFMSQEKSDIYIRLKAPLIEIIKPDWVIYSNNSLAEVQSLSLGDFEMMNADIEIGHKDIRLNQKINIGIQGLYYDNNKQIFNAEDINFNTKNINIALDNGFYNLYVDNISFTKKELRLENASLKSPYSMMEFAYKHPQHTDWFDVSTASFSLMDIDLSLLLRDKVLISKKAILNNGNIKNFKNKQIKVPERIIPMIYENIQKAPVQFSIDSLVVNKLDVVYEELAPKGKVPGKIVFSNMNGIFHDFTNIVKSRDQYIRLEATGKLMDSGLFTATWMLPVDSLNDHFKLNVHLPEYNLITLNEIVSPLAPVRIETGNVDNLTFVINGSSISADIYMRFLYNDLIVNYLKNYPDDEFSKHKIYSAFINSVVRNNNPRRKNGKPHIVDITVKRDPYHSTFNYIWQILRPSFGDAVGVPQRIQNFLTGTGEFINDVKSIFQKDNDEVTENE